jgi:mannosyltransferase
MIQHIDAVHGTYYLLMHFWIQLAGTSNLALRAPSAIGVGIACAGVVVLGYRLGGRRLAIAGGLVFLLLPRVTWMGMEARSLAFTAAVAVWLTVLLLRALERRTVGGWTFYAALATIGVLLNIYVALLVLAHGLTLVLARDRLPNARRLLVGWAVSAATAAVLSLPIDRLTLTQAGQLPKSPLTLTGTLNTLVFAQYFSGATPTLGRGVPVPPTSVWALAVIAAAVLGWLLLLAPLVLKRLRLARTHTQPLGAYGILVPWAVLPTVLVILVSLVAHPMYSGRYFSFTTPAIALLIGATVSRLRLPWMRVAALAALALLVLPVYVAQRGVSAKNGTDWQHAAAILQTHARPGQDIYYGPVKPGAKITMHKLAQAYPPVVSSLNDITLRQTDLQLATLWNTNWPLAHARGTLATTPLLWAVLEHPGTPSPASTTQERYIESQGLHLVRIWHGSETDVLEFRR